MNATLFGLKKDAVFMQEALKQAAKAYAVDEVPIGAVVVDAAGTIIGRGFNKVERTHTQASHAEMIAIAQAGKKQGDWRLDGCWLYVTLEPCTMCIGLVGLSRLAGIVYGAESPLFGFQLDNEVISWIYKKNAFIIIQGIEAEEARNLLKKFFKEKRKKGEWVKKKSGSNKK